MADYKPQVPFNVPAMLLVPEITTAKGSTKKIYPQTGYIFYCSFRSFGGTESTSNGVLVVENTAKIETWYRPDIKSDCRIKLCETDSIYEVVGEPENISMRNQWLSVRIRQIKGGV